MFHKEVSSSALLVGRFLLAFIFLMSGLHKLGSLDQTAQMVAAQGLPAAKLLAVTAAFVEIAGAISLLVGFGASAGAVLLLLFLVPTTLVFHDFWTMGGADRQMQFIQFMKNLAIGGGLIYSAVFGAGEFSLDHWLARHAKLPAWWPRPTSTA